MNNTIKVARQSPFTGKLNVMKLNISEQEYTRRLEKWMGGELIQNAFPMLSAGEREFIKTGITPKEWDEMFKD
jgi:hypothetical protein